MVEEDTDKQNTLPNLTAHLPLDLPTPSFIGPYKIESLYKKGGMSLLYLGLHPKQNQPLIIKILSPKYAKNKEVISRFLKEAQIISMSHHPNIIQLYGQGTWDKGLYIAMEFIQGISLRQFIQMRSFSLQKALQIILQVAYALCHLHSYGVIHRDVKPENILITEKGEVKVIDFGIAQLFEEQKQEKPSFKKRLIGTPNYMSPEQKQDSSLASFASDIYSLGVIAYELITGQLSRGNIHLSLIDKNLRPILEKALAVDVKNRYSDIVDFITDLSYFLKNFQETKEENNVDDVFDSLKESSQKLFSFSPTLTQQMDIFSSFEPSFSLTGLYVDFFKFLDGFFVLCLAEPKNIGIKTLLQMAHLKGIFQTLLPENLSLKEALPEVILHKVNQLLMQEQEEEYHFIYLLFHPESDQLYFATDKEYSFFINPKETLKISSFTTPNPLLGKDAVSYFAQTTINWNIHDKIFLVTQKGHASVKELLTSKEAEQEKLLVYPLKTLTEKLQSIETNDALSPRLKGIITCERKF